MVKITNVLCVLVALNLFIGCVGVTAATKDESVRSERELTQGWRFFQGEVPDTVITDQFNDSSWQLVTLPHSWNRVGVYRNALVKGLHTPQSVDSSMGVAWYRLNLGHLNKTTGQKLWLEFDAVSRVADVWLNGAYLGEHRGGFNRFRFDITQAVRGHADNLLVVKVDNSKPTPQSATFDTLPIAGDFFVHGGIYRSVRIVTTDALHIDMMDYGGPGVYASTQQVNPRRAKVRVESHIKNDSDKERAFSVVAKLLDANSQLVSQDKERVTLAPDEKINIAHYLKVSKPNLWHGVENPYLYTLQVSILENPGRNVVDQIQFSYGIRSVEIDPDKGLLLNGKPYRIKGVSYHQDKEGKGWAVADTDVQQDLAMLVDMGANSLRLSHYPHGQTIHELANQQGIILWDEIPLVTTWTYGKKHASLDKALAENAKLQLVEMIKQNYNHPSVVTWGIANELDFSGITTAFLGLEPGDAIPTPINLLEELHQVAKSVDRTRVTTQANCCQARPGIAPDKIPDIAQAADTVSVNRYFGWYYGQPQDLSGHLDTLHQLAPNQPLAISEYGAGGGVSLHTDNILGADVDATGFNQPEEYMSYVHEQNWAVIKEKPYVWASWIWNGFDFATHARTEGDTVDINTKGLITYDRSIKKDAYYFYRANWSHESTVHITQKRYRNRAYSVTDVRVYSNAQTTELVVNGKPLSTLQDCPNNICVWSNVALLAGDNNIVARGKFDGGVLTDSTTWSVKPENYNHFNIDAGALVASPASGGMFGSDNFFIGGQAATLDKPGGWGRPPIQPKIVGAEDRLLTATYRAGDFSYRIPTLPGKYKVELVFVAESDAINQTFNVYANGENVLKSFNVTDAAGVSFKENRQSFEISTDSGLELKFESETGPAVVSAIKVQPM